MARRELTEADLTRARNLAARTNWERRLFDKDDGDHLTASVLTDEQVQLFENIKDLEKTMFNRKHDTRFSQEQNRDFREKKLFEIEVKFYNANQEMAKKLDADDLRYKKRFEAESESDPSQLLLDQKRWENRYSLMDKEGLRKEAADYLGNDNPSWTSDRLDILGVFLNRSGIKKIGYSKRTEDANGVTFGRVMEKSFSEWIETRHGREPHRKGRDSFYTAKKMYESEFGQAVVLNSFKQLEKVDIEKIYIEKTSMEE